VYGIFSSRAVTTLVYPLKAASSMNCSASAPLHLECGGGLHA
jgi:hypothetical protein